MWVCRPIARRRSGQARNARPGSVAVRGSLPACERGCRRAEVIEVCLLSNGAAGERACEAPDRVPVFECGPEGAPTGVADVSNPIGRGFGVRAAGDRERIVEAVASRRQLIWGLPSASAYSRSEFG